MLAALLTWLTSSGVSMILTAVTKLALDAWNSYQADQHLKELGAAQAQLSQASATIAAQQDMLQAQADAPKTTGDTIKRLRDGSA